ncbi:MAG: hypothetical protein SGBAC_000808, partial [Bacillariaceae sp.]
MRGKRIHDSCLAPMALLALYCFNAIGLPQPVEAFRYNSHFGVGRQHPSWMIQTRGGAGEESAETKTDHNATVEEYIAAMKEKDVQDQMMDEAEGGHTKEETASSGNSGASSPADSAETSPPSEETSSPSDADVSAGVGLKSHSTHRKSNAVGDPDGDDDDDDDTEESESDFSDFSEEWEDSVKMNGDYDDMMKSQVQFEVEVVEEEKTNDGTIDLELEDDDDDDEDEIDLDDSKGASRGGGGVRVRLGRMNRRKKTKGGERNNKEEEESPEEAALPKPEKDQGLVLEAWMPHIYFPPTTAALSYLSENARLLDASSKNRLDRRTLYAGLLLEWGSTKSKLSSRTRRYLNANSSQLLQAALSMATQPQWRKSAPRTSGIRLYQDGEETTSKMSTLGMQETMAMALAHSLGCGMLILDDQILNKVRQQMIRNGFSDDAVKPAVLLQSLLTMAKDGKLQTTQGMVTGSISSCMKRDTGMGLDDPYDERAFNSFEDMCKWETMWVGETEGGEEEAKVESEGNVAVQGAEKESKESDDEESEPIPLLVFLRTGASNSLLKSKSAMELLIKECTSPDSIHLIALGKGIDASTTTLPKEEEPMPEPSMDFDSAGNNMNMNQNNNNNMPMGLPGQPPFHGFSNQNQNASGQFDPEGSRRFNFFLARTMDQNGQPGLLGAIAPPQAGNMFPHMMAMQARERLQADPNSPAKAKAELERWAEMLQSNMQDDISPPQFFNATLADPNPNLGDKNPQLPPPEVIEQTLQAAMTELIDRFAQMAADDEPATPGKELSPDLYKAFGQVVRNSSLRKGIAENLSQAARALSDPKCQGVMLSVYVPPPHQQITGIPQPGQQPGQQPQVNGQNGNGMNNWFQKILNNQDEDGNEDSEKKKQKRVRTMAAAAAMLASNKNSSGKKKSFETKASRNLARLESICRPIPVPSPEDPVRSKSWESWIARERGAVVFRKNRSTLNQELEDRKLALEQHTGTRGAGSALRQML